MTFRATRDSDTRYTLVADGSPAGFAKLMPAVGRGEPLWWAHVELADAEHPRASRRIVYDAKGRSIREALANLRRHIEARVGFVEPIRAAA